MMIPRYSTPAPVPIHTESRKPRNLDQLLNEVALPEFQKILPPTVRDQLNDLMGAVEYNRTRWDETTRDNILANLEDQIETLLKIRR